MEIEAQRRIEYAGGNGEMGDRGARELRKRLDYWLMGIAQGIPREFKQYEEEYKNQQDPEYQEYLRLKEKFNE